MSPSQRRFFGVCGIPVEFHFNSQNAKVSCEEARSRWLVGGDITPSQPNAQQAPVPADPRKGSTS